MQELQHLVNGGRRRVAVCLGTTALAVLFWGSALPAARAASPAALDGASVCALPPPVGPLRYDPGRGLHFGKTGLSLGGYAAVDLLRDEGGPGRLALHELSLFPAWDPSPHFRVFSEIEFEDLLAIDDRGRGGTADHEFRVERLYGDLMLDDPVNLRVGKFLTPVGRWNVIHAQPLVWTTSRPLATLLPFDQHTTGAMLFGSVFPAGGSVTYSLFGQFLDQFEPIPQPQPADRSAGARLEYGGLTGWGVGATYVAFRSAGDWQHLGGADALWQGDRVELMGEWVFADSPGAPAAQWGFYFQAVVELVRGVFLVGRYEHFDQRAPKPEANLIDLGVAYKPVPYLVFKAEYLIADRRGTESAPGVKSSVALLF